MSTNKTSGQYLVNSFLAAYMDKFEKDYLVNYRMVAAAGKISKFYSHSQINKAIKFYIKVSLSPDFFWFINNINLYVEISDKEEELKKELKNKLKNTKNNLKNI